MTSDNGEQQDVKKRDLKKKEVKKIQVYIRNIVGSVPDTAMRLILQ